ncbi:hypothetical protein ACPOL_1790 [Acidisarcina polymorpha]|uniref:Uncharacterized protein n=1 Tax=Acidisarcina polymorpha TaxID=2211140 RepID=A0A2Z5FWI9_9BACT|nr:hypothetical protein ACPOL_1790 [Acidisarcina polymorpha]
MKSVRLPSAAKSPFFLVGIWPGRSRPLQSLDEIRVYESCAEWLSLAKSHGQTDGVACGAFETAVSIAKSRRS